MKNLRFACIGGWHMHTDRFIMKTNEYPGCAVTEVWDPDWERGKKRAERFSCKLADRYEEVLEDPTVDGVLITSPARHHYEQVAMAVKAGKHVFVEKPAFIHRQEAYQIRALLADTKVKFLVSDPIRTSIRQLYCAKEIIANGRIGQVTMVRTRCAMNMASNLEHVEAFNEEVTGGGVMYDLGSHAVHMLKMLLGRPERVHAAFSSTSMSAKEYGVEDNAVAVYEYHNGAIGIAETSALAETREDFFLISGTNGSICCMDRELRFRTGGGHWITVSPDTWPQERIYPLYNWIDSIWDDQVIVEEGVEDAVIFTEMLAGAYEASAQAAEVSLKQ